MAFNILFIRQVVRFQYGVIMLLASLRQSAPNFNGQVCVAEPQPTKRWD